MRPTGFLSGCTIQAEINSAPTPARQSGLCGPSQVLAAEAGSGGASRLPKPLHASVRRALRQAWELDDGYGVPIKIVETVMDVNDARKRAMAAKVVAACGGSLQDKTVAVLGLTFKPNTDDMREAPSLVIVPALEAQGARVRAYDPQAW